MRLHAAGHAIRDGALSRLRETLGQLEAGYGSRARAAEIADEAHDVVVALKIALQVEGIVLRVEVPALALAVFDTELAHRAHP